MGPTASALASLRRAGVEATWQHAMWRSLTGEALADPLEAPRAQVRQFLLRAYRHQQFRQVASRRPSFAALTNGVDYAATVAVFKGDWQESTCGALRAVMAGSVVTESIACKWSKAGDACPHCRWGVETPWHRWWECPAWEYLRRQRMGEHASASLASLLPETIMLHGILPEDAELLEARRLAEAPGVWPDFPQPFGKAWTDGNAVHPRDPYLRRAACAVCLDGW